MQSQLATRVIACGTLMTLGEQINKCSMKYIEVNDTFSGNTSTMAELFGLKKTVSTDFGAPTASVTVTGNF
jgi:hypothetical protein